jgi:hypothetical protein
VLLGGMGETDHHPVWMVVCQVCWVYAHLVGVV